MPAIRTTQTSTTSTSRSRHRARKNQLGTKYGKGGGRRQSIADTWSEGRGAAAVRRRSHGAASVVSPTQDGTGSGGAFAHRPRLCRGEEQRDADAAPRRDDEVGNDRRRCRDRLHVVDALADAHFSNWPAAIGSLVVARIGGCGRVAVRATRELSLARG